MLSMLVSGEYTVENELIGITKKQILARAFTQSFRHVFPTRPPWHLRGNDTRGRPRAQENTMHILTKDDGGGGFVVGPSRTEWPARSIA
jgi:hypothetical protein